MERSVIRDGGAAGEAIPRLAALRPGLPEESAGELGRSYLA